MNYLRAVLLILNLCSTWVFTGCGGNTREPADRGPQPNILLLVADDLGYADLGCYGGDIATPNIDSLAARGIRFSRFYTAPMCAPTRAMLLSGNDNHIAGVGRQNLFTTVFGYEGHLTERVAPLPALLRDAGYHTYMAGKWHLGNRPEDNPHQKGFEHSYVLLEGVGNHYGADALFKGSEGSHYTEDGQPASWEIGAYSTELYTDKLIGYIDRNKADGKPFFAYAAYTAPHWPLQVDSTYLKKYEGRYDLGYEALREERLRSLKGEGMIPEDATLPAMHSSVKPWQSLSVDEKKKEARKMELYAGMLDQLDENIGRLLKHLRDIGELEDTFIIFMSDNGAAAEDYYNDPAIKDYISERYSNTYENMGSPTSLVSYGPQWAEAGSAPFRYFKEYTTNGGMLCPMIIAGPSITHKGGIYDGFVSVLDIAPTFLQTAGVTYPERFGGHSVFPLKGSSLLPFATGSNDRVHPEDYIFGMEHTGYTTLLKGNWKITNIERPYHEDNFELYDLNTDLAEQHDLKTAHPQRYRELLKEWETFSKENRLQLPH